MISDERPSPYNQRPSSSHGQSIYAQPHRPAVNEDTLKRTEIQIERKIFGLTLKENAKGRFLRITEDSSGKHNTIIIPSTGLEDFKRLLNEMAKASDETPVAEKTPDDPDAIGNR